MILPDIDRVTALIREVAAAEILPRFRSLGDGDIREKGPGDLVTVADEAAERVLTARLPDLLPGSLVIGEEAVSADPSVMERLSDDRPVWIVDPVDGTINFANGRDRFGTIVALARGGRTIAGWIVHPVQGRAFTAVAGEGTWADGERIRIPAPPTRPEEMRGLLSVYSHTPESRERMEASRARFALTDTFLASAFDYPAILTGERHFVNYRRTLPWDHAAGILMVTEAGGAAARPDRAPYTLTGTTEGILVVAGADIWETVRETLFGDG